MAGLDETYKYNIDVDRVSTSDGLNTTMSECEPCVLDQDFVPRGVKLMAPLQGYFWGIVLYPVSKSKGLADIQVLGAA